MNSRILGLVEAVLIAIITVVVPGYAILKPSHIVVGFITEPHNQAGSGVDGARIAGCGTRRMAVERAHLVGAALLALEADRRVECRKARRRVGIPHL